MLMAACLLCAEGARFTVQFKELREQCSEKPLPKISENSCHQPQWTMWGQYRTIIFLGKGNFESI